MLSVDHHFVGAAVCTVPQVGDGEFLDRWEPGRPLARRQGFVLRMLRHVLQARQSMQLILPRSR